MTERPMTRWHRSERRLAGARFELTLDEDYGGFRLWDDYWRVLQPDFSDWWPMAPGAFHADPESAILQSLASSGVAPYHIDAIFIDLFAPEPIDVEANARLASE